MSERKEGEQGGRGCANFFTKTETKAGGGGGGAFGCAPAALPNPFQLLLPAAGCFPVTHNIHIIYCKQVCRRDSSTREMHSSLFCGLLAAVHAPAVSAFVAPGAFGLTARVSSSSRYDDARHLTPNKRTDYI